ncbi:hypothetical protein [Hymenobacter armeniacus]|uniref:Uncharacterized protein n=1 Tax=Hymenobacter armeniacus TaxID=2771358 RepID=A0ABR8JTH8_9BACT|nr:hypothetical protein [Hymenobacter armeniacus]MBD2722201.1 hypothetical protein [Hymenobacter armeniacus]
MNTTVLDIKRNNATQRVITAAKQLLKRAKAAGQHTNLTEEDTQYWEGVYFHEAAKYQIHLSEFQDNWGSVLFGLPVEGFEPVRLGDVVMELEKLGVADLVDIEYLEDVFRDLRFRREQQGAIPAPHEDKIFRWLQEQKKKYRKQGPASPPDTGYDWLFEMGLGEVKQRDAANKVLCPPHTWLEIDELAQRVGIIKESKEKKFALTELKKSAVTGFAEAMRAHGMLRGGLSALHKVLGERYGVVVNTDRPTKTRTEYFDITRGFLKGKK